ncbi:nickel-dependent lactate racemase [Paenibacillus radicis (ex Xue et al. 2023)]|uniref:Nickel-dependent lactate racemase n=1 Tax=Paenibacillus radicis (ex Xue et al. 2023) TaxID=2972489 RepID=A0ABT1YS48_9BACL|nr:nickel-dependent lactate racemase [Paenibacillus radicis (ex Xue et al. 2023)]MCR8636008.1 nickel-dependent lactate racemase [Paenibacillus radicis (ex Xue et al. 2023)]
MKTTLLYGKHGLSVEVPDHAVLVEPHDIPGVADEKEAVLEALRQPIASPPLREMVKATDRIVIVISDITRPTPNDKLVPWIISELPHVPLEQITILNGTGTHRDQTHEEFVQMLGESIVDKVRVINHHCQEPDELVKVGRSSFGCDAYLNKTYVEADFRIVTGFIEPHFFAGFSGGCKGIMPGIAGLETIMTFHNARMIGNPLSTWGNLINNPLQEMAREINLMCKPEFMLNVTLNGQKQITGVFAGELFAAHAEGCAYTKQHAMARCEERFDVVITSNSGYPLDQNLYQAVKGMSAAHKIVKQGGAILCAAECSDGIPNHGNYAKILQMADTPQQLLDMIEDPNFQMFDQWQVQKQAVIQVWADVYVQSRLTDEEIRKSMLKPMSSIEETLSELQKIYGEGMSIAILPQGPLTIPYVEE